MSLSRNLSKLASGVASDGSITLGSGADLTFTGTGNRITGDFSNATAANRVWFQTSTANSSFSSGVLPNGTGARALWAVASQADPTNASTTELDVEHGVESRLRASRLGTGTYLPMTFYTGGSERMRIDTSGNLGLGVTPSAWGAAYKAMQVGATGALYYNGSASTYFGNNYYVDNVGTKYLSTFPATAYGQTSSGQHQWFTAPSGTAGNAISFTQAMTLDASGNLLVGTTSGSYRLLVSLAGTDAIRLTNTSGNGNNINFLDQSWSAQIQHTAGNLVFGTGGTTERMRIDSSGNLLVGANSAGYQAQGFTFQVGSTAYNFIGHASGASAGSNYTVFGYASSGIGSITQNGTTGVSYNTSSDYRLKENIQPMQNALAVVQQLNPVTYTWKNTGEDGQGFIAHELQEVVPDCVTGEKDAVDAEGNPVYQGIDTSFLVATLTKAIQELEARVKELESK